MKINPVCITVVDTTICEALSLCVDGLDDYVQSQQDARLANVKLCHKKRYSHQFYF